jgi:membrane protein DedA with SNARE-associated domain
MTKTHANATEGSNKYSAVLFYIWAGALILAGMSLVSDIIHVVREQQSQGSATPYLLAIAFVTLIAWLVVKAVIRSNERS